MKAAAARKEDAISATTTLNCQQVELLKPALISFSPAPAVPSRVDPEQFRRLTEFKHWCRQRGIVFDDESVDDLAEYVRCHVLATIRRLQ
jgi:hypothetical protein